MRSHLQVKKILAPNEAPELIVRVNHDLNSGPQGLEMLTRTGLIPTTRTETASDLAWNAYPQSHLRLCCTAAHSYRFGRSASFAKGGSRHQVTLLNESICLWVGSLPGQPSLPCELPALFCSTVRSCVHIRKRLDPHGRDARNFKRFLERGQDVVGPHWM